MNGTHALPPRAFEAWIELLTDLDGEAEATNSRMRALTMHACFARLTLANCHRDDARGEGEAWVGVG